MVTSSILFLFCNDSRKSLAYIRHVREGKRHQRADRRCGLPLPRPVGARASAASALPNCASKGAEAPHSRPALWSPAEARCPRRGRTGTWAFARYLISVLTRGPRRSLRGVGATEQESCGPLSRSKARSFQYVGQYSGQY